MKLTKRDNLTYTRICRFGPSGAEKSGREMAMRKCLKGSKMACLSSVLYTVKK